MGENVRKYVLGDEHVFEQMKGVTELPKDRVVSSTGDIFGYERDEDENPQVLYWEAVDTDEGRYKLVGINAYMRVVM